MKGHRRHPYSMFCPVTGKRGYATRGLARQARRGSRLMNGEKTSEWSVYRCQYSNCGYWHIGHNHNNRNESP